MLLVLLSVLSINIINGSKRRTVKQTLRTKKKKNRLKILNTIPTTLAGLMYYQRNPHLKQTTIKMTLSVHLAQAKLQKFHIKAAFIATIVFVRQSCKKEDFQRLEQLMLGKITNPLTTNLKTQKQSFHRISSWIKWWNRGRSVV